VNSSIEHPETDVSSRWGNRNQEGACFVATKSNKKEEE
jgi:hypothetical protein